MSTDSETLRQEASRVIGSVDLQYDQFLTWAIYWAGDHIADFSLSRDDERGVWQASGSYNLFTVGPVSSCEADNPHDAMARLIIHYNRFLVNCSNS